MEEHFHQSTKLPKETLKELMKRSDSPGLLRMLLMFTLFFGSAICVVYSWSFSFLWILLAQLAFGLMCCSVFAFVHETVHKTAFKSKFLNEFGARLGGLVHLYPATAFQELHFTHHRYTHIPGKDPEISMGNKPLPSVINQLPSYLVWITGIPLLIFKILMLLMGAIGMPESIRKILFPFVRPEVRVSLMLESCFILFVHIGLLYLAINIDQGFYGLFIGQVVGHCILATYLVPEHNGLPHEGDILDKTRSMKTNRFVRYFMWNMPYHAEHHAYPAIPFHALPKMHELINEELKHKDESYTDFHLKVMAGEFKEKK